MPYLASNAFWAASDTAFSDRKGPPGTARMTKKVTVMTIQIVRIAMAIRFKMYFRVLELIRNPTFHGLLKGASGSPSPFFALVR